MAEETANRLREFRNALQIDKNDLDTMLVEQPVLFHEVMDEHALAVSRRDKAKNDLDTSYSETYLNLRRKTSKDKPSEAALKHMVETSEPVQDAQAEYFKLKKLADRWDALVSAFKDRSYMLREIANLHVTGYYMDNAGGKTRGDASTRVAESIKEAAGKKRGGS